MTEQQHGTSSPPSGNAQAAGQPERVLVVAAHPDDADFGAAGTIAGWTDAGIDVAYCIVTFGDAGGFDDTPREQMPALREAEQRAAAKAVGVSELTFLGYPDGRLTVTLDLRRDIARQIRRFRPQRVVCPSPQRNWVRISPSHPDHLAVGEATLCAVYPDARNPFAHPELLADEGLAAWTVGEVWLLGGPQPNHYVDVTDTFERKIAALRAHTSQTAHLDLEAMLRPWLGANAAAGGLAEGRLAEAFQLLSTG
jgi:LmbE family N-acetylglucosaminyl deacetylase